MGVVHFNVQLAPKVKTPAFIRNPCISYEGRGLDFWGRLYFSHDESPLEKRRDLIGREDALWHRLVSRIAVGLGQRFETFRVRKLQYLGIRTKNG